MARALDASKSATVPNEYFSPTHLPLLVHAAITGDDLPALPLATACTLLWAGAELYDNLTDGDLTGPWQQGLPFEVTLTAMSLISVVPAIIAGLNVPDDRRAGMLSDLAPVLLQMFDGQWRDLTFTGSREPDPSAVETSVVGKNGRPMSFFAGSAAHLAGVRRETQTAYVSYGLALGVVSQLQSDHWELFFSERKRDLEHGTRTLQIALYLQSLSAPARGEFVALLERARTQTEARSAVCARLRRLDVLRPWMDVVVRYARDAEEALDAADAADPAAAILRRLIRNRTPRCA